jgi:hypothetical protein
MWWRILLHVVGGIAVAYALLTALLLASFVRLESAGDLTYVYRADVRSGLALTVGIVLLGIPLKGRITTRRFGLMAVAAFLAGGSIAGGLAWGHHEQYRIRSTLD